MTAVNVPTEPFVIVRPALEKLNTSSLKVIVIGIAVEFVGLAAVEVMDALGAALGCRVMRVHEVGAHRRACDAVSAITRAGARQRAAT